MTIKIFISILLFIFIITYTFANIYESYYPNPINNGINDHNNKVCI